MNQPKPKNPNAPRRPSRITQHASRTAFTFVELLFAVIILGIGFIMIAGLFPVAIRQSRLTGDETVAAADGRSAAAVVQRLVPSVVAGEKAVTPAPLPGVGLPPTTYLQNEYISNASPSVGDYTELNSLPAKGNAGSSLTVRGRVYSFRDPRLANTAAAPYADILWSNVEGNLINPTDPRSAYVLLYRRDVTFTNTDPAAAHPYTDTNNVVATPAPAAQLIVLPVQVRNRTQYDLTPGVETRRGGDGDPTPGQPATLEPKPVGVILENDGFGVGIDKITLRPAFSPLDTLSAESVAAAAEGSFVVISQDNNPAPAAGEPDLRGAFNGRIYRLGTAHPDLGPGVYELAPGYDLQSAAEDLPAGNNATAFLVGRGLKDPSQPYSANDNPYEGLPQDVAAYTTFIRGQ